MVNLLNGYKLVNISGFTGKVGHAWAGGVGCDIPYQHSLVKEMNQ
jgi:hypothetical protein